MAQPEQPPSETENLWIFGSQDSGGLQLQDHTDATSPSNITTDKLLPVFEGVVGKSPTTSNTSKVKVAKLMDSYLAEVARDANLALAKFQSLAESLPDFSRATDDGLYRAIDTYLKVFLNLRLVLTF